MLRIKNICKSFNGNIVLSNIELMIEKGIILGLAGPSGGGKSTLLRLIQRLELPDYGTIECDAKSGFMFQDFQLFPHMTVMENIIYAPKMKGIYNYEKNASAILKTLGILQKANEYPSQLSGGQKQRVALARSLMMEPDILLCDEPTSGLDVVTVLDVVALLRCVKDMGVTMIIASHDLDFLTNISDKILLIKDGKIALTANPHTINDPINYLKSFY